MELTESERKVLRCVQLQPEVSAEQVAKVCELKSQTVRNILKKLKDRGVLNRGVIYNVSKVGLTRYRLALAVRGSSEQKQGLIDAFLESSSVEVINQLQGEYQIAVQIAAGDVLKLQEVIESSLRNRESLVRSFTMAPMISLQLFGSKYLADLPEDLPELSWVHEPAAVAVTAEDNLILKVLRKQPESSLSQLTRLTGIPQSTVAYRLKRLREESLIITEYYHVPPQSYGLQVFDIALRFASLGSELRERVNDFARRHRLIDVSCRYLGDWQYILSCPVHTSEQVSGVCSEIEDVFGGDLLDLKAMPHIRFISNENFTFSEA